MLENEFLHRALIVSLDKHKSFFYDACDVSFLFPRHAIICYPKFQWIIYEFLDQKALFAVFHVLVKVFRIVEFLDPSASPS